MVEGASGASAMVDATVEGMRKSKTFGGGFEEREVEVEGWRERAAERVRRGMVVAGARVLPLLLSYVVWVIVDPLPLERSELPVTLVRTESKEGSILTALSWRLDAGPVRCRSAVSWREGEASRWRRCRRGGSDG